MLRILPVALLATLAACGGGGGGNASSSLPVTTPTPTPAPTPSPTPQANILSTPSTPGAASISFSGYTWTVRNDTGLPGPNTFSANNAWVDSNGFLHLKISHTNGAWSTAEVGLNQSLGFGTYQWVVMGHPETMDNNVVLGFFNYPTPAIGPDGTNEIDIEFATWGGAQTQHLNWTVFPAVVGAQWTQAADASPFGGVSTQTFAWNSSLVTFNATTGLPNATGLPTQTGSGFAPRNPLQAIPQTAEPVYMNLWLFDGHPPTDGNEVEIVVTSFTFTPG